MKGFLGTGATFAADLNLIVQVAMGIALLVGTLLARRKRYAAHGLCQTFFRQTGQVLYTSAGHYSLLWYHAVKEGWGWMDENSQLAQTEYAQLLLRQHTLNSLATFERSGIQYRPK